MRVLLAGLLSLMVCSCRDVGDVPDSALVIEVPGKVIRVDPNSWKPMKNEFEWAVNFEEKTRGRGTRTLES